MFNSFSTQLLLVKIDAPQALTMKRRISHTDELRQQVVAAALATSPGSTSVESPAVCQVPLGSDSPSCGLGSTFKHLMNVHEVLRRVAPCVELRCPATALEPQQGFQQ